MANYHEYDDLFASYERRSSANKHDTDSVTDKPKSAGYTSSSSYKKTAADSGSSALGSVKSKASSLVSSAKDKVPKNKTPEKSQKKYFGNTSYDTGSTKRVKKSAMEDSGATVQFNYNSTAKNDNRYSHKENADLASASKDDYRKKYEQHSGKTTKKTAAQTPVKETPKEKKEKTPRVRSGSFKKTLIFLICVLAATLCLTLISISCVNDVLAINRHSDKAVTITIDKQVDTKTVIKMLKDNHLIKNELFCNLLQNSKAIPITTKPEYSISKKIWVLKA